ncbi:hypothetical protein [Paenibacillus guangzhouensis]|uniref:hypothetical protein n=1 Tax=Paenibacillus guangzhouensis TaxID=1473112 RepID=UPI001266CFCB|nr:hypothetical protein [Paenibacillus guangzhouensis]
MKNIAIFTALLAGSLLFDLVLDMPLGVSMYDDVQMILRKIQIIHPIILWLFGLTLVIILYVLGTNKKRTKS